MTAHQGLEGCAGLRVTMWGEGAACGQFEGGVGCDKQSLAHPPDRVQVCCVKHFGSMLVRFLSRRRVSNLFFSQVS